MQAARDAADADRATAEDRLYLLKDKFKLAQRKLQSLRSLVSQVGITHAHAHEHELFSVQTLSGICSATALAIPDTLTRVGFPQFA